MNETKISCGGFIIDDGTLEEVNGVLKVKSSEFVSSNFGQENSGKILGIDESGDVTPINGGSSGGDDTFYWCTATLGSEDAGGGGSIKTITLNKTKEELMNAVKNNKLPAFFTFEENGEEPNITYVLSPLFTCVAVYETPYIGFDGKEYDASFSDASNQMYFAVDEETGLLVYQQEGE